MKKALITLVLAAAAVPAQTTINGGRTVKGAWDASGATMTKPVRVGTADPATCLIGELYYRSDTSELKQCSAADTWTKVGAMGSLPIASGTELGAVKVGSGLQIDGSGTMSASGAAGYDVGDESVVVLREDFLSGNNSTTGTNAGSLNWGLSTLAGGTISGNTGDEDHVGVLTTTSSAANADSGAYALLQGPNYAFAHQNSVNNKDWTLTAIVKLGAVSNSRTWIGLGAQSGIVPARFVGFRYDTSANYADDTKNGTGAWVAQMCTSATTCAEGSGTEVVLATTPDTNWHRFQIAKSGTTYRFRIDGAEVATACASGCSGTVTAATAGMAGLLSLGYESAGSVTSMVDYFYFRMTGLAR